MYKILYLTEPFEPFFASWGSLAIAQPYEDGWMMPDGWQSELDARGISYVEMDVNETQEPV